MFKGSLMKQTKNLANSKVNTQSVLAKDPINIHIWMKASEKNRTIKKENESVMGNGKSTGRFGMVETERWGKYRRMRKVKKNSNKNGWESHKESYY